MNLADWSFKHPVLVWVLTIVLTVAGVISFGKLGRLEDPNFTIKTAMVYTQYAGADAAQVEEEVTEQLESAIQRLSSLWRVRSLSQDGLSAITVDIKKTVKGADIPQVWDELRRKVSDAVAGLPPGCGTPLVVDDFGDVYGHYLAMYGDDYSHAELYQVAKNLQQELVLVDDVAKVELFAVNPETVEVRLDPDRMSELGLTPQMVANKVRAENLIADAGTAQAGSMRLRLTPTAQVSAVQDIGSILVSEGGAQIRLRDVAEIVRTYRAPPAAMLRANGSRAIGIGISCTPTGNVVNMGAAIERRLAELEQAEGLVPWGVELQSISFQSNDVTTAINAFNANLVAAVVIVIVVLMLFMGLRPALIIGGILVITIFMTFVAMLPMGIALQRISLGALIIALGMLVDNAIVVVDGMMVGMQRGRTARESARDVVGQTAFPLLGATMVAILAFSGIGLSPDSTGEFCGSLFYVVLLSLGFSWVTAVTITPLIAEKFLAKPKAGGGDPLDTGFYRAWQRTLGACLKARWMVIPIVIVAFGISLVAFTKTDKSFFPDATRPQFTVDVLQPQGSDILATDAEVERLRQWIAEREGVTNIQTVVGQGAMRFILTYTPDKPNSSYAQLLVGVDDPLIIPDLIDEIEQQAVVMLPGAIAFGRTFALGPSEGGKIQCRLVGMDQNELRATEAEVIRIMRDDGALKGIRSDWRTRVPVVRPVVDAQAATNAGLSVQEVADALRNAYQGRTVGVYRENDDLLPIILRSPAPDGDIAAMLQQPIWSPVAGQSIPLAQVVHRIDTVMDDPIIGRWNRARCIIVSADPEHGPATVPLARIMPQIDALANDGVKVEWGGEYENSQDAQKYLITPMAIAFSVMILIVVALFDSVRRPLVIWLCVPLAIIGVAWGLLLTGQPFGFMALLGFLSLSGMLVKNAIVLVDEIEVQRREGMHAYAAVLNAGTSRLRPVLMAAATTVLGMVPLFADPFFAAMAVAIVFGLLVATVLTMVIVPVLYVTFYRIHPEPAGQASVGSD